MGEYKGLIKGDARSLDYSSYVAQSIRGSQVCSMKCYLINALCMRAEPT